MARRQISLLTPANLSIAYPWAYFPLDEGGGDGSGVLTDVANDDRATTLADLSMAGGAFNEHWSIRPGFLSLDGTTEYVWRAAAADLSSVFALGLGSLLLCLQVALPRAALRRTIFLAGSGLGAGTDYGYLLIAENDGTNQKVLFQIRDDAANSATMYTGATAIQDGGATVSVSGITRSGSTATASIAGHSMVVGDYVYIAGAGQAEYNGMHKITAISAGVSINFTVTGTPATPATGTITAAKVGNVWNLFLAIDNRAGVKSAAMYSQLANLPASGLENASVALTSHGTVTLEGAAGNINPGVYIGRNARSSNFTYSPMNIRRLMCINFGADGLPSNLATKIMPALHRSGMVPTYEAFDAIAAGF